MTGTMSQSDATGFREHVAREGDLVPGKWSCRFMHEQAAQVRLLCQKLNSNVRESDEIRGLLTAITGKEIDASVSAVTPFVADFGWNLYLGKNVFMNADCSFQDQSGVWIGDNAFIGHNAMFATLNHDKNPTKCDVLHAAPIAVEEDVWIGTNITVLSGVTIGRGAVMVARTVAAEDMLAETIVAGVPAKPMRRVCTGETGKSRASVVAVEERGPKAVDTDCCCKLGHLSDDIGAELGCLGGVVAPDGGETD